MPNYALNKFDRALVRPPSENFADGVTEANLGFPQFSKALEQHAAYCAALQECGLELIALPAESKYPDACFVEDTAIVIDDLVVITRIGHEARRGEESSIETALIGTKEIKRIKEPGTVDGGDVMRVGDHFFIGLSKRTNKSGAEQLTEFVRSRGKTASTVPVENYIHLKTFMTAVDQNTIIGLIEQIPKTLIESTTQQLAVPAEEHFAANCLSANDFVVIPAGCPETEKALRQFGKKVISVDVSEFQKMDGRLTCLSILF